MKLSEFRKLIDELDDTRSPYSDPIVTVKVKQNSVIIGFTPSTPVKSISVGFDWDAWQIMLRTEDPLYKDK